MQNKNITEINQMEQGPQEPNLNHAATTKSQTSMDFDHKNLQDSSLFEHNSSNKPKTPANNSMVGKGASKLHNSQLQQSVESINNTNGQDSFRGTFHSQTNPPNNKMMRAILEHKAAQEEKIKIEARIIKLKKDEERATKRIKDNLSQVHFREQMHKLKYDKMVTKQGHYSALKEMEDRNRSAFMQKRNYQKFVNEKNKKEVWDKNYETGKEIKAERRKI